MIDAPSLRQRLAAIDGKIENAERRACAESDLLVTIGHGGRFSGCGRELEELKSERRDIQAKLRGSELTAAMDAITALDVEISRYSAQRTNARLAVERQKQLPAVQRWLRAPHVAAASGVGHAWALVAPWIASRKQRYNGPVHLFALDTPEFPQQLKFNEQERETICRFNEAQDELTRIEQAWSSAMDRKQQLLRNTPELQ